LLDFANLHGRYGMKTVYGIIGGYKGCVMDDQWATWLNIGSIDVATGFLDAHFRAGSDFRKIFLHLVM